MLFSIAAGVGQVSAVKVFTENVIEETKEELPNFTSSFEDDLAVFLASKSNETKRHKSRQLGQL